MKQRLDSSLNTDVVLPAIVTQCSILSPRVDTLTNSAHQRARRETARTVPTRGFVPASLSISSCGFSTLSRNDLAIELLRAWQRCSTPLTQAANSTLFQEMAPLFLCTNSMMSMFCFGCGRPLSKFFCTSTWESCCVYSNNLPSASAKEFG